jgi:hypothetical protein
VLEINSRDYLKERKVLIDGIEMSLKTPGAGTELRLSAAQRRIEFLEKKLKSGTITSEELDTLDRLEQDMLSHFNQMLRDGSQKNEKVWTWLNATPLTVIIAVMEDMKRQFDENDKSAKEGDATGSTPAEVPAT